MTLEYTCRFAKCKGCGKEFLVESVLFGIDHTADIVVTCKDCLKETGIHENFVKEHPEEAKTITKWLQK